MNLRIGTSRIDRFRMHYQGVCEINFLDVGVQTFDCQDDCLFDDVNCIAFVVNVSSYDVFTGLSCELNALERQIQFFDRVTKVTWSKTTSVVVILRNIDEMENKLGQNPFSRYFHDFEDSNDAYSVLRYIKGRITSANLNNCSLNFHITYDPVPLSTIQAITNSMITKKRSNLILSPRAESAFPTSRYTPG